MMEDLHNELLLLRAENDRLKIDLKKAIDNRQDDRTGRIRAEQVHSLLGSLFICSITEAARTIQRKFRYFSFKWQFITNISNWYPTIMFQFKARNSSPGNIDWNKINYLT